MIQRPIYSKILSLNTICVIHKLHKFNDHPTKNEPKIDEHFGLIRCLYPNFPSLLFQYIRPHNLLSNKKHNANYRLFRHPNPGTISAKTQISNLHPFISLMHRHQSKVFAINVTETHLQNLHPFI